MLATFKQGSITAASTEGDERQVAGAAGGGARRLAAGCGPLHLVADASWRWEAGQSWVWYEVRFDVLHPPRESYDAALKNNGRGCVVKVNARGSSVLIPADVERRSEEALLARGASLASDVVIAGHHGSKTSSTVEFVEAVRPRAVVFSVGYRNRFGHPHPDVIARYRESGAALYRTDSDGAIRISIPPEGLMQITRYRDAYRRYWLDAPAP